MSLSAKVLVKVQRFSYTATCICTKIAILLFFLQKRIAADKKYTDKRLVSSASYNFLFALKREDKFFPALDNFARTKKPIGFFNVE